MDPNSTWLVMVIQSEYTQMYASGYIICKIKLLVHSCILECIENHKCIMKGLKQTLTSGTELFAFLYPPLFENNSYINQVWSFQRWVLRRKQLSV